MSSQTNIREEEATAAPADAQTAQQIMNQIVGEVRRDSQAAAETYLQDTTVPHGGE